MPYNDDYANEIKKLSSNKVIFTGYIKNQEDLSLYIGIVMHIFMVMNMVVQIQL